MFRGHEDLFMELGGLLIPCHQPVLADRLYRHAALNLQACLISQSRSTLTVRGSGAIGCASPWKGSLYSLSGDCCFRVLLDLLSEYPGLFDHDYLYMHGLIQHPLGHCSH